MTPGELFAWVVFGILAAAVIIVVLVIVGIITMGVM